MTAVNVCSRILKVDKQSRRATEFPLSRSNKTLFGGCRVNVGVSEPKSFETLDIKKFDELETVDYVDLKKFMGDWYVIANIPTFIEKGAVNAIESYKLDSKGRVKTTFTFRKENADGPQKKYSPTGFIYNKETNAEWRMQFLWPFKSPFLVIDLDDKYSYTVIGVPSRKYVWIMAREYKMYDDLYNKIVSKLDSVG